MLKQNVENFSDVFAQIRDGKPVLLAGDKTENNAMMVNWGGIGYLWNKRVCFIFVRKERYTTKFLQKYPDFTLNFLDLNEQIIDAFGRKSGKDIDKFAVTGLHKCIDIDKNLCSIAEAKQVLKCHTLMKIDLTKNEFFNEVIQKEFYNSNDLHILYIAEITNFAIGGNE